MNFSDLTQGVDTASVGTAVKNDPPPPPPVDDKKQEESPKKDGEKPLKVDEPSVNDKKEEPPKPDDVKDQKGEEEPPKQNRADRQYHKLLRERAEARAEAKLMREENERLRTGQQQTPQNRQPQSKDSVLEKPLRQNFPTQEEYETAKDTYYDQQIENARQAGVNQARVEAENRRVNERLNTFKKDHPDYDKVISEAEEDGLEINNPYVFNSIKMDDNPGMLSYYLAKNPAEAQRIDALNPQMAVKEIGRLSMKLELESKASIQSTEPTKKSKTPPPAPDLDVGGKKTEKQVADMKPEEVDDYWLQKMAAKRKG